MNYVALPMGNLSGWGVCGDHITQELANIGGIEPIFPRDQKTERTVPGPLLQAINGPGHEPATKVWSDIRNVGYTFFEMAQIVQRNVEAANRWDWIATGSDWCTKWLRDAGIEHCSTVDQGVDHALFHPNGARADDGRFVVFSGGCFQLRKGQDVVMAAMKVFMDRHPNAVLVASWGNPYEVFTGKQTMMASKAINYRGESLPDACAALGMDLNRVAILPVIANHKMPEVYRATDVGLFPNRCEGGTNLVLMEYMATGKPVIATHATGQAEILTRENSIPIDWQPMSVYIEEQLASIWAEPSVEDTISKLEWAYRNRELLAPLARQAAEDMRRYTWRKAAEKFLELLQGGN